MRQMTYKQAATCGENLKARVTSEQSEKMQLAWFAAGKTWRDGSNEVSAYDNMMFMFLTNELSHCVNYNKDYFINDEGEEIELIDDLPQPDFASQQEVWMWLGKGNKAKRADYVFGFNKNGVMWNFTKNESSYVRFSIPEDWKKHTPPRLIRVNGVEVPAPLESLDGLHAVYVAIISNTDKYLYFDILLDKNAPLDYWLKAKLCYATKEDAIKRAEAMRLFEVVE